MGRLVALAVLIGLVMIRIADPTPVKISRAQSFDLYQRIKPRVYTPQPVAILDINEDSIRKLGQWPWPRTRLAKLVEKLMVAGAVVVGFDIVFAEADRLSPDKIAADNEALSDDIRQALTSLPSNDLVFAEMIKRSRVVMGQTSVRSLSDVDENAVTDIKDMPHAFLGEDPRPYLPNYPALVQNLPELEQSAMGRGVFTVLPDEDGVFRHVPLLFQIDGKLRLSLSAEILRVATGGRAFAVRSDEAGVNAIKIGRSLIDTDRTGTVWPYFTPTVPSRFVSAVDVLEDKVDPRLLKGRLFLVGTSAIGLEDFRATPMGSLMAGVEIHAQVIENILTNQMLVRPNYAIAVELLTILVVGLIAIAAVPFLSATWAALFASVVVLAYIASSYYAFATYRLLIDPVFPSITVVVIFIILATFNYLREERKRREIRSAFGQYVSPDLVSELADSPEGLALGGETRELSILFSDVRGFTAISESFKSNPQGLTVLMNEFLTVLSNAILHHNGTIDKFMGDAVMAFWNAPVPHEQHARSSCLAALKMLHDVDELNKEKKDAWEAIQNESERGPLHQINIGIGINSGDCVVGNMGSELRFDYTCLGDPVNLASRLEGQSKPYGVLIILGQNTAAYVEDELATLEIDQLRVKGKQEPETVYGLFGDETMLADENFQELQKQNNAMLAAYRNQDWETVEGMLELMKDQSDRAGIDLDVYLFMYETRVLEFRENPPGRDWDGVYVATSK
ncbi:MAG: adenylate/guanylate cyclase domain-containing protein [Hyphomicrobiales bacterium]|nr:adenylate/guanylate cyclase domain-containing protein [Hyphomicrobiales bacterium]